MEAMQHSGIVQLSVIILTLIMLQLFNIMIFDCKSYFTAVGQKVGYASELAQGSP